MSQTFDLHTYPGKFPDAMAAATRLGRMDAMSQKPRIRATRELSDKVSPGCANGYASALKQAYNAGYWAGGL